MSKFQIIIIIAALCYFFVQYESKEKVAEDLDETTTELEMSLSDQIKN